MKCFYYKLKKIKGSNESFELFLADWLQATHLPGAGKTALSLQRVHHLVEALVKPYPGLVVELNYSTNGPIRYAGGESTHDDLDKYTAEENRASILGDIKRFSNRIAQVLNYYYTDRSVAPEDLKHWTLGEIIHHVSQIKDEEI